MRERESNNNTNLDGFARGDANDIDGVATEKPRPSFVGDDPVKDFRERMAMAANHQMRADGLQWCHYNSWESSSYGSAQ